MTIRVRILNDDSRPNAIIKVRTVDATTGEPTGTPEKVLTGWTSTEALVHSGQKLIIEEVQNG